MFTAGSITTNLTDVFRVCHPHVRVHRAWTHHTAICTPYKQRTTTNIIYPTGGKFSLEYCLT